MRTILLILICFLSIERAVLAQQTFYDSLSTSALALTKQNVTYDPTYFSIPYPNGDVPSGKGVCTDVVIRAYRKLGIDLQKEVHEDMKTNFKLYLTPRSVSSQTETLQLLLWSEGYTLK